MDIIHSLTRDEATAALAMIGADHEDILADAGVRAAVDRSISLMARAYNETTLANLKQALSDKLSQAGGTNLDELTNAVDGVYSFADERRAGLIAKTESFRSANYANLQAWEASGVVKTVKWYDVAKEGCLQPRELGFEKPSHDLFDKANDLNDARV